MAGFLQGQNSVGTDVPGTPCNQNFHAPNAIPTGAGPAGTSRIPGRMTGFYGQNCGQLQLSTGVLHKRSA
jgi:hypothetical protein